MIGNQPGEDTAPRRARGSLAAEVLAVLHAADTALSPGQVRDRLAAAGRPGPLSYSTVVTVLSRLHAKGLATRSKRGHAFAYAPADDDEPGLAARRMRQVLDDGPDRQAVLARFVGDLGDDDERLLRRLLGTGLPGPARER